MSLTKRDKLIIDHLNKFRVMDRDSIAELFFSNLKNPKYAANNVLLRLVREGHIQRSTSFTPYVYFGSDVSVKKNSAKIGHFLAILNVYKDILQHGKINTFLVEPKYGNKGMVEPDVFCIYRKTPFFIEVQNSIYSERQMKEKMNRYLELYHSGLLLHETWQPEGHKIFPHILIISNQRYALESYPFHVFQAESFTQFIQLLKTNQKQTSEQKERKNTVRKIIR